MRPVVQEEPTGCGIAAVAAVAGVSYARAKRVAASLGIHTADSKLWSDTKYVRRLLIRFGARPASSIRAFRSWDSLPDRALLAIKWRQEGGSAYWHWVVFTRENRRAYVLDSKKSLKVQQRTDFGRMKPKWFLPLRTPQVEERLTGMPASVPRRLSSSYPLAEGEIPDIRGGVPPARARRRVAHRPFPER